MSIVFSISSLMLSLFFHSAKITKCFLKVNFLGRKKRIIHDFVTVLCLHNHLSGLQEPIFHKIKTFLEEK